MPYIFHQGETAFIVANGWRIREVLSLKIVGGFATIRFLDGDGATRLHLSRLFHTKEDAEASKKKKSEL